MGGFSVSHKEIILLSTSPKRTSQWILSFSPSLFCSRFVYFLSFVIVSLVLSIVEARREKCDSVVFSRHFKEPKETRSSKKMDYNMMDLRGAELYWKCLCKLLR